MVVFRSGSPPLDGRPNDIPLSASHAKSHSSPARSPSPLRNFLWPLHRSHSREEPFVPVDPYKFNLFFPPQTLQHLLSQLVRQLYRHFLLRLPSIYFTRVSRVFEDAEVSRPEVQRMIEGRNIGEAYRWPADYEWVAPNVSPSLIRFKESWESFVESVLKEWKTLNVVSTLLMTCVVFKTSIENSIDDGCLDCLDVMFCQGNSFNFADPRSRNNTYHSNDCILVPNMCPDEFSLWVHIHLAFWHDEGYVPGIQMGRSASNWL